MTLIVDGELIPEEAIEYELQRLVKFYAQHLPSDQLDAQMGLLREKAREQAIGARLLIKEADRLDITVPEDEVNALVNEMIASTGGVAAFEELLKMQSITEDLLRQSIVNGRKVDILVDQITAIQEPASDEELRAFFTAHQEEYTLPERVLARHILIKPEDDSEEEESLAESKLNGIRQQLVSGASFEDLAWTHSECPSGRNSAGSIGWVNKGSMVDELDEILFNLKKNQVSDVVKTPLGFHLIEITDHAPPGPAAYEDVEEQVRDFVTHAKRGEIISRYVQELKEQAVIQDDEEPQDGDDDGWSGR